MSKAADDLRDLLSIYNPHNASQFAKERGGVGVYLSFRPTQRGRAYLSAAWQVVRPGYKTDASPEAHWTDYGHKTFSVFMREGRVEAEQQAREWASERYGVEEWVKVSGLPGALYPAQDAAIIKDALKAARKTAKEQARAEA